MPGADPTDFVKYSGWLPLSADIHATFIDAQCKTALKAVLSNVPPHHQPVVAEFEKAIKDDVEMVDLFQKIFHQVHEKNKIPSFEALLHMLDAILISAPPFHIALDDNGTEIGEPIGVPIYLLFDLLSNTSAGYDLFRLPKFNLAIKTLLDAWGSYLSDPKRDSNAVLHSGTEGWFSQIAVSSLEKKISPLSFEATYILPDPQADNRGFQTWDAFFTRKVKKEARPVTFPDEESALHSACESTVYRVERGVKACDQFWIKGQNYSLYDILNKDDEMVAKLAGGTVYQAFLDTLDYHRWHAPIDGTIEKVVMIDGSYYAALPDGGAPASDELPLNSPYGALVRSQSFLTITASRALIYIRAKNANIGVMCFVAIGMGEVSTCDVTVAVGDRLKAGDELGMFHFGGSSHALIFGPQCEVKFFDDPKLKKHVWVNSVIGRITPKCSRAGVGSYYSSRM
ncbi:phosphatidylserine decarboxylase [Athelia psychrophila]|uniref:Phosphatidylserine decarboxylase n=1 Tax=Athelia psychrophila TaxID=1759441 RepID=A0A166GR12_9AGAM|nr:phosphatidylserine decarboxylase [Fibularhizoctonia sp. CBS 109695]